MNDDSDVLMKTKTRSLCMDTIRCSSEIKHGMGGSCTVYNSTYPRVYGSDILFACS